jgi:hypothetical protein
MMGKRAATDSGSVRDDLCFHRREPKGVMWRHGVYKRVERGAIDEFDG